MNRCAEKAPGQDQVPAVFKTKSLTHQLKAEPKRKRIADDIEPVTHEAESEEHPTEDLRTYVAFRLTLMFAYARAGCTKLLDAPAEPDTKDRDAASYVEVPLDIVLRYHGRLVHASVTADLPWIRARDEEERQLWVELHRSSKLPRPHHQ